MYSTLNSVGKIQNLKETLIIDKSSNTLLNNFFSSKEVRAINDSLINIVDKPASKMDLSLNNGGAEDLSCNKIFGEKNFNESKDSNLGIGKEMGKTMVKNLKEVRNIMTNNYDNLHKAMQNLATP